MTTTHKLVDIEFATTQLGGNVALLAKLLHKFCDEFTYAPQQVKDALAQNDVKSAKLKVHTAKGLSGNIGLTALYECSKVVEQQISQDNIDLLQVDAVQNVMQDTIKHIKTLAEDLQYLEAIAMIEPTR
jgi:HPt (histidine-containing phosphotransfer) domain-containing protein